MKEKNVEKTAPNLVPAGIDIAKLVASVKGRYGKKNKARADDVTSGNELVLSSSPDDYILSPDVVFWEPLTGIKGIPYGRIVQISGRSDSGKTSSAMLFMKAAQLTGSLVILWDSEKKFSTRRYIKMGGDPSTLAVTRAKNIQDGANQVAQFVRDAKDQNPKIKIFIVWDSVGATMNSAEDDDDDGDMSRQPGVSAKENSWAIKKLNKIIERYRDQETGKETVAMLCINQVYANIGSVGFKEKGGDTLYYACSLIIQMQRKSDLNKIKNKQKIKYGILTRARVKKNHLFDGEDCIAEMNLVISADSIVTEGAVKSMTDIEILSDDD